MITARAAGDAALLVEAGPQAGALAAAVRAARLPGVTDVVTGAVTVLLVTEPGRDLGALAAAVGALPVLVLTGKGARTNTEGGLPKGTLVFADLAEASRHLVAA